VEMPNRDDDTAQTAEENTSVQKRELEPDAIRSQMLHLLASPEFNASPAQKQLLRFVIDETLAGRSEKINQYAIGVEVFGYASDFNPQYNPAVRVQAGRLRQALGRYYKQEEVHDKIHVEIPKGTYVPVFTATHDYQNTRPVISDSGHTEGLPQNPSLAVLPFSNLSSVAENDYYTEGLGEEITLALARFQELSVISFYSSRYFRGGDTKLETVRQAFGVDYVIIGRAVIFGGILTLSVSLVDALDKHILWAEQYAEALTADNVFEVRDAIVQQVVAKLGSIYGVIFRKMAEASLNKRVHNLTTHEAILRFYHYQRYPSPETHMRARRALEQAVRIGPGYALVWATLSELYADTYTMAFSEMVEPVDRALVAARKALSLDPLCQHAHNSMAYASWLTGDDKTAIASSMRVYELNPNQAYLVGEAGFWLFLSGEEEEGLTYIRHSMKLNPYYPTWLHHAFMLKFYRQKEYKLALEEARRFNSPDFFWDPLDKAIVYSALDEIHEAREALNEVQRLLPDFAKRSRHFLKTFIPADMLNEVIGNLKKAGMKLDKL